jgi:hypothetical protein
MNVYRSFIFAEQFMNLLKVFHASLYAQFSQKALKGIFVDFKVNGKSGYHKLLL